MLSIEQDSLPLHPKGWRKRCLPAKAILFRGLPTLLPLSLPLSLSSLLRHSLPFTCHKSGQVFQKVELAVGECVPSAPRDGPRSKGGPVWTRTPWWNPCKSSKNPTLVYKQSRERSVSDLADGEPTIPVDAKQRDTALAWLIRLHAPVQKKSAARHPQLPHNWQSVQGRAACKNVVDNGFAEV